MAEEDAPAAVEYVPALHWEGSVLLTGQNAPGGQMVLAAVEAQYEPAGHGVFEAVPPAQKSPG